MEYDSFYLSEQATINYLLCTRRKSTPNKVAYTFLEKGEEETATITYEQLYEQAGHVARELHANGVRPGERALLLFPSCIEYVVAFLGCLRAAVIAVPLFPPQSQKNSQFRMETVSLDCSAAAILTTSPTYDSMQSWLESSNVLKNLPCVFPDKLEQSKPSSWLEPRVIPETIAFLQYTSGSTGAPKGVVVTHRNLVHNEECLRQALQHDENSNIASWLPIFHDMGLIGNILQTIYVGAHCVFMPPIAFVQKPIRWLNAITKYRCQTSMAPNFAYDLCCERVSEQDKKKLDLSCWQSALNGSEPVRYETLERFAKYFADCGFDYKTLYPGYGLAESTLMVTSPRVEESYHHLSVSAKELSENKVAPRRSENNGTVELAASGRVWCNTDLAIVNPSTLERCSNDEIGEIWVHSASVARGYWNNTAATEETFCAQIYNDSDRRFFMRTGDLGFLKNEHLYVTGRHKELVLIRGQNYYPQDIERSIQNSNEAFVVNGGAAFSLDASGEEKLIVVQEIKRTALRKLNIEAVVADAYKAISAEHELKLHCICLLKPARLSKTSSGKIQRRAMKAKYLASELEPIIIHHYTSDDLAPAHIEPFNFKRLENKTIKEKVDAVSGYLVNLIASVAQVTTSDMQGDSELVEIGLDSMSLVNLQHLIVENFCLVESESNTEISSDLTIDTLSNNIIALHENQLSGSTRKDDYQEYLESTKLGSRISLNQESLWLVQYLYPTSYTHNVVVPIEIHSELKLDLFRETLSEIIQAEEVFRKAYQQNESGVNAIENNIYPHLDSIDCRDWTDDEIATVIDKFWKRPFKLETEVPARFILIRKESGHIFVPVIHHIITDMWSILIFLERLFISYQNGIHTDISTHPYSRFAYEQARHLDSDTARRGEDFWVNELEGCQVLRLPTSANKTAATPFKGKSIGLQFDNTLTHRIKSVSKDLGVTPYIFCLSSLNILLSKISGQSDFVIGTATAGRNRAAYRETLGYFVNPIPLRTTLNLSDSIVQYIHATKRRVSASLSHQEIPFQRIIDIAGKNSNGTTSPLFNVMFAYQSLPRLKQAYPLVLANRSVEFSMGDFSVSSVPLKKHCAQYPVTLTLVESDIGYDGVIEFDDAMFSNSFIESLAAEYTRVIDSALNTPNETIAKITGSNTTEHTASTPSDAFVPITEFLDRHSLTTPDALAIKDNSHSYTYSDFAKRVNQLSHWLLDKKFEKEAVVAVHMERSCLYSVVMQAIIQSGLTYLPLDTELPPQRLEHIIRDAKPILFFNDESSSDTLQSIIDDLKITENFDAVNPAKLDIDQKSTQTPIIHIASDQLAYIIYTSGSTGTPKGVLCTHQGLRNCIEQCATHFELDSRHRMLQSASYSFDASIWNCFLCLYAGSSLIIPNRYQLIPGPDLVGLINKENINYCFLSPTLMAEIDPRSVPGLTKVVAGGEELQGKIANKWFSENRAVYNAYGPTETSICATVSKCTSSNWVPHIGKPLENVALILLDEALDEVPNGQEGEIYISGISLARGYLNSPEKDRKSFIDLSDSSESRIRFYKTGDRAVLDEDGNLHYRGRKDGMVKIAGHRIELGEIRNVLIQQINQIDNAAVIVRNEKLECFYVTKQGAIEATEIRNRLVKHLPNYMIPSSFTLLRNLPQTPSGKIDRKALMELGKPRDPEQNSHSEQQASTNRDELAGIIHECWRSVLGHDQFANDDLFFEVGGTSILLARLHYLLQERLTTPITMVDLYQYSTINMLLKYLYRHTEDLDPASNDSRAEKRKRARKRFETAKS